MTDKSTVQWDERKHEMRGSCKWLTDWKMICRWQKEIIEKRTCFSRREGKILQLRESL